jgi:hypothetical protein
MPIPAHLHSLLGRPPATYLPQAGTMISAPKPLRPQVFARFLASHPNEAFVSRLIHSLTNGFDIGYVGPHTQLTAPNFPSAYQSWTKLFRRRFQNID